MALIEELVKTGNIPAEIRDALACENPDVASAEIILLGLEQLGPVERETVAKLHAGFPQIPLIVLAGPDVASRAGEAIMLGAQHVLGKLELTPARLSSALMYYLRYSPSQLSHTA